MPRLLPASALLVFGLAALAGVRTGRAAVLPKPDLVVASATIGGVGVEPGRCR